MRGAKNPQTLQPKAQAVRIALRKMIAIIPAATPALMQPVHSDDVAAAMADVTLAAPVNGMVELAGPERISMDELARQYLKAKQDSRQVVADIHARYFGAVLGSRLN